MMKLNDILPIFKKHQITYKEKYKEVGDIYTFIFDMGKEVQWKAGQHGVFTVDHKKIKKATRAFSIASIPSEGHIKISMKIGKSPSEFKQALLNLKQGMTLSMRGPIGSFYVENQKPLLFIAGGIGITPYRALIKDLLLNSKLKGQEVELLYMDSRKEFIYVDELKKASGETAIKSRFLNERSQLNDAINAFISKNKDKAEYYIVGPKSMTKSIDDLLKNKGVHKKNIKKDAFIGY